MCLVLGHAGWVVGVCSVFWSSFSNISIYRLASGARGRPFLCYSREYLAELRNGVCEYLVCRG